MAEQPTNPVPAPRGQRPARPGEMCSCGRPATVAFVNGDRETPWCGAPSEDDPARAGWERTR